LVRSPQQAMKFLHEPGTIPSLMRLFVMKRGGAYCRR
jgi:hypothetical protein